MYTRSKSLTFTAVAVVMCTAGLIPSVGHAAEVPPGVPAGETVRSYAENHGLTAADVMRINTLNETALSLGQPGKPTGSVPPNASESARAAADGGMETPPAEPLDRMPDPYRVYGGRASTSVGNYIRKWQQVYSQRDGQRQQMTEAQRQALAYGCVGVTWVNSGNYPTNKLGFAFFDESKYKDAVKNTSPRPGETQAEFEGRIAKQSFDEEKGFNRARDVASVMNKALEGSGDENAYLTKLKAELGKTNDALADEDGRSNFYAALRNTPSFRDKNGGNSDPSKMKAVIYSKHFWSAQDPRSSADKRKFGDPEGFRPNQATGLVDMSKDRNTSRSATKPGESFVNFDYGWFGDQKEPAADKTIWTHANHFHNPNGDMGPMNVYESRFQNWSSGYADFDRGAYMVTFIPKSWNTAPDKVTQGWR
ncbi:protein-glutamine gamma-glutamyltransferase [Streptomyces sp. NPDC056387]|uniref:protein-glutamine gamma-glutamyltransferase n=1 Tax=Streptomyces sp. NPDC056387 TaxID=3345803 RepID=UPI0035DC2F73